MRDKNSRPYGTARTLIIALLALGVWGCADAPQKPQEETTQQVEVQPPAQQPTHSLDMPPSAHSASFNRAEQYLARFDWMRASVVLQTIPLEELTGPDNTYLEYLQARIEFTRGDQQAARSWLNEQYTEQMHPALRYRILSFKHHLLELQGDYLQSANTGDQILRLTPPETAADWRRKIWRNLQRTDLPRIQASLSATSDPQWLGWLQLAAISREKSFSMTSNLSLWRQNHPGHPASDPLPGGLAYLLEPAPDFDPVALMLPLSGRLAPAGKAVLDGYLAAYYEARTEGSGAEQLLVLNTEDYPSANAAYEDALRQGARIAVGPLSKESVVDLALRPERAIPILALNQLDQALPASGSALVQLALTHADEATRLAELGFGRGARSALVISPAGEWGTDIEHALRQRWSALGGTVAASVRLRSQSDYSNDIKSALSLTASEQRARDIRSMLATNIESTPRRRQDPDIIFLLTRNGSQARAVKPLFAFHYAGALPVYANSSIHNGVRDERNNDLNGIHTLETPWLLGASPALRVAIADGDTGSGNYTRLNALGADAFLLQSGFSRLNSGADALFRGNTGLLSMDPKLRIHRELSPATFDGGVLKAR